MEETGEEKGRQRKDILILLLIADNGNSIQCSLCHYKHSMTQAHLSSLSGLINQQITLYLHEPVRLSTLLNEVPEKYLLSTSNV